ncbi:MAG: ATP-dependent DNA helicase RecG [Xanthomonadales bacterium]|nr:ATP-dependent DNA helicase RecG [Xanthomonadales bacterium]
MAQRADQAAPVVVAADWQSRAAQPLKVLGPLGPKAAQALERLGLQTVGDLWVHLPLRYEDRTQIVPLSAVAHGQTVQIVGRVGAREVVLRRRRMLLVTVVDGMAGLTLRFFRFHTGQAQGFQSGRKILCYGEVRGGVNGLEMAHPKYRFLAEDEEPAGESQLRPTYPRGEGISSERIEKLVQQALSLLPTDEALEWLPAQTLDQLALPSLGQALRVIHRPPPETALDSLVDGSHPARRRLALEELIAHRISLRLVRRKLDGLRSPILRHAGTLQEQLLAQLPFSLTSAQQRVLSQIRTDLARSQPMLRLVQGDVGSGKTIVAALAMLAAIEGGHQAALMAPTELLAEQHRRNLTQWFDALGLRTVWLAAKVTGKARAKALEEIAAGAPVVIGTHALMTEQVQFERLGLVVIDEQHRFGVHQRLGLRDKGVQQGRCPHQLVMTATPIPRTLAMSLYADLDVSVIDELPPGRSPIRTVAIGQQRREEVVERVREACSAGRQAYWVCTVIEVSDQVEAQAAEVLHAELAAGLPDLRIGLVHGRQKATERSEAMNRFAAGELDLLVATTVIEVGVDVPNASLMVIENAERLGLAQLHQLRGRVGRGTAASSCVLLYKAPLGENARARIGALRDSQDGFHIAECDLALRGPGELLGSRQSGSVSFRVADLARDVQLIPQAAQIADPLVVGDPERAEQIARRFLGASLRYGQA